MGIQIRLLLKRRRPGEEGEVGVCVWVGWGTACVTFGGHCLPLEARLLVGCPGPVTSRGESHSLIMVLDEK